MVYVAALFLHYKARGSSNVLVLTVGQIYHSFGRVSLRIGDLG